MPRIKEIGEPLPLSAPGAVIGLKEWDDIEWRAPEEDRFPKIPGDGGDDAAVGKASKEPVKSNGGDPDSSIIDAGQLRDAHGEKKGDDAKGLMFSPSQHLFPRPDGKSSKKQAPKDVLVSPIHPTSHEGPIEKGLGDEAHKEEAKSHLLFVSRQEKSFDEEKGEDGKGNSPNASHEVVEPGKIQPREPGRDGVRAEMG